MTFFQNLFARTDDFRDGLRLTPDHEEYLYEKDTSTAKLNDDIKIELNEGVVNYLESHRKGFISVRDPKSDSK